MDSCAQSLAALTAGQAIMQAISRGEAAIRALYEEFGERRRRLRSEMVFLQEEIDFTVYAMYRVSDESLLCDTWDWPTVLFDAGMRPFEILQQRNLDDFPVPEKIPNLWPPELRELWQRRMDTIRRSKDLSLIEDDHYKRRWLGRQGLFNHTARQDELKTACESWLLDRSKALATGLTPAATNRPCNPPHALLQSQRRPRLPASRRPVPGSPRLRRGRSRQ